MAKPACYRTANWSACHDAPRKCGASLIWRDRGMAWQAPDEGRPAVLVDAAIRICLSIKVLFKRPLIVAPV